MLSECWSNVGSKNSYVQTVETVSIEPYGHFKKITKKLEKEKGSFHFPSRRCDVNLFLISASLIPDAFYFKINLQFHVYLTMSCYFEFDRRHRRLTST